MKRNEIHLIIRDDIREWLKGKYQETTKTEERECINWLINSLYEIPSICEINLEAVCEVNLEKNKKEDENVLLELD